MYDIKFLGRCLAFALLAATHPAFGQADNPAPAAMQQRLAADLLQWTRELMAVPADLPIDDAIRREAESMAQEHLSRMGPVYSRWSAEEYKAAEADGQLPRLEARLLARYMNEVALWRLERPSTAYDAVMLQAWLRPAACRRFDDYSYFAQHLLFVQQIPQAGRPVALAGERDLLARWDRPRQNLPPRPVPSLEDMEDDLVERLKTGSLAPRVPMVPAVAAAMLRSRPERPTHGSLACALHQWGLAIGLAAPDSQRDSVITSYRYAMMPLAADWLRAPAGNSRDDDEYPPFARSYEVEGTVMLEVKTTVEGLVRRAVVVGRDITVRGVRGIRPVAFETALDEASIAKVTGMTWKVDPAKAKDGLVTARVPVTWRLQ